jgi:hypothetical protein
MNVLALIVGLLRPAAAAEYSEQTYTTHRVISETTTFLRCTFRDCQVSGSSEREVEVPLGAHPRAVRPCVARFAEELTEWSQVGLPLE